MRHTEIDASYHIKTHQASAGDGSYFSTLTKTTDLQHACQLAKGMISWKKTIVGAFCSAAEAEKPLQQCPRSDTAKKKKKLNWV